MPLFQKKENVTSQEKRRSLLVYWLFGICVLAWAVAMVLFYIVYMMQVVVVGGSALGAAFTSSLVVLVIAVILSVAVYFISEAIAKRQEE